MTSSTILFAHNILHHLHRRAKPQPQLTCTENFVQFGRVVWDKWVDRETYRHSDQNTLHPSRGKAINRHLLHNKRCILYHTLTYFRQHLFLWPDIHICGINMPFNIKSQLQVQLEICSVNVVSAPQLRPLWLTLSFSVHVTTVAIPMTRGDLAIRS